MKTVSLRTVHRGPGRVQSAGVTVLGGFAVLIGAVVVLGTGRSFASKTGWGELPAGTLIGFLGLLLAALLLLSAELNERKQAENALRASNEYFRALFEHVPLGIAEFELSTARFVALNQRYADILGYPRDNLLAMTFKDFTHPEDLPKNLAEYRKLVAGEIQSFAMEKRCIRKDGSVIWCKLTVSSLARPGEEPQTCMAVIEDITDRKRAEEALRTSEQDQRLFALAINDTLWSWDFATSSVERSVGFEKHFGYPVNAIEPGIEWWSERVHPHDRTRVNSAFAQALKSGAQSCSYQYRFRKRDGTYATVEDRVYLVRDGTGKPVRALGAMTNLASRIEQHSTLLRVLHQLMVAEEGERRRIAKELHDSTVQGLVAAILNLEFLREQTAGRTPQEARQIDDSLALLENCAHEIRTLSYLLHPPRLEEAGLAAAIRQYVAGVGERTGLAIAIDVPADLPRFGDTAELILFRLVQESLGNIHRHAHSKTASVRLRHDGAELVLEISDEGRGIPPAILDPQKGTFAGLGVGIPGMRERLRHLGGRLEIESSANGTTVRAVAPLHGEHS